MALVKGRRIKFYSKNVTIAAILLTVGVVLYVLSYRFILIAEFLNHRPFHKRDLPALATIAVLIRMVSLILFFINLYQLIGCFAYFKRLRAYGYPIPESKKKSGYKLYDLPRQVGHEEQTSLFAKDSRKLSVIGIIMASVAVIAVAVSCLRFAYLGKRPIIFMLVTFVVLCIWLIPIIKYRKQSNTEKYCDDVELTTNKRKRRTFEGGMIWLLLLLYCSAGVVLVDSVICYNGFLRDDVRNAGYAVDAVKDSVNIGFENYVRVYHPYDEDYTDSFDTMQQLSEGCNILTWGEGQDPLQKEIISTFRERFDDEIPMTDGEPVVWVQIVDGVLSVELKNPSQQLIKYSERFGTKLKMTATFFGR